MDCSPVVALLLQGPGCIISVRLPLFIELHRVLWALSNIFKEVKARVANRMEMSVKPLLLIACHGLWLDISCVQ